MLMRTIELRALLVCQNPLNGIFQRKITRQQHLLFSDILNRKFIRIIFAHPEYTTYMRFYLNAFL